jgi:hypothetical protein
VFHEEPAQDRPQETSLAAARVAEVVMLDGRCELLRQHVIHR